MSDATPHSLRCKLGFHSWQREGSRRQLDLMVCQRCGREGVRLYSGGRVFWDDKYRWRDRV